MSMRGLIDSVILADAELTDIIPASNWREAWNVDDSPPRPFAEYRWRITGPSVTPRSPVRSAALEIYIHDEQGSFDRRINPAIARLRTVLDAAAGTVAFGASLIAAEWREDGPDAYDDGYRTAVRYTRYQIIGTGL